MKDKKQFNRMFKVYWALFSYTGVILYLIIRSLLGYEVHLYLNELPIIIAITIIVFVYTGIMSKKDDTRIYKKENYPPQIPIVTKDKKGNIVIKFKEKLGMKDPSINYDRIHEKLW